MPTEGHLSFLPQDETAVTTKANTSTILIFFINNLINSYKITEYLANNKLREYLNLAMIVGNQTFILKYKAILGDFASFIAEQNQLSVKLKNKVPQLYKVGGIINTRSLEQCTAEAVAVYKSTLIKGDNVLTLASGLGIDDIAFSKRAKKIISIDNNEELNIIARFNFKLLGITNIERKDMKAESFLAENKLHFDAVYVDPDRRDGQQRQILLAEHQPNILNLLPTLFRITPAIWIKCSPLYDIDMALKEVEKISEIYVISLKGEVKEMLLKLEREQTINPKIICVDIGSSSSIKKVEVEGQTIPELATSAGEYFYEAGATLVKARKHHAYAAKEHLKLINQLVPFYFGNKADDTFIGKCMRVKNTFPFNQKQLKLYIKSLGVEQINIKTRGVKVNGNALFKLLGIKEGGEDFLFIYPFLNNTFVLHCTPL